MIELKKGHYSDGNIWYEEYILDGKRHREDGPAFISYYSNGNIWSKRYYLNGKYHRKDGPAFISYYDNKNIKSESYLLNGKYLTKEEWFSQLSAENKLKVTFGVGND